jgi:hypothetical protein
MKTEFSQAIFEKYSSMKILQNSVQWKPTVPCGLTGSQVDRQI